MIEGAHGGDPVKDGTSRRDEAVLALDLRRDGGCSVLAVYQARLRRFPLEARMLELHRLSEQVLLPLTVT